MRRSRLTSLYETAQLEVHTMGIDPPPTVSVQRQANIGGNSSDINDGSTNGPNSSSSSSSSGSSIGKGVNLNSFANLIATEFAATISSANATALVTDSRTKVIQSLQIRSLNEQKTCSLCFGS